MPGSYLTPDPWFVSNKRLNANEWSVMLRTEALKNEKGPHMEAAGLIVRRASLIAPLEMGAPPAWVAIKMVRVVGGSDRAQGTQPSDKIARGP